MLFTQLTDELRTKQFHSIEQRLTL